MLIPAVKEKVSHSGDCGGRNCYWPANVCRHGAGCFGCTGGQQVCGKYWEASCHEKFKQAILASAEGDTHLSLKKLTPVRLLKNDFYKKIEAAENENASAEQLEELLGRGRAKAGMFEGDLSEGELEIGHEAA